MAGEWLIQDGSNSRRISEEKLRKKLRSGDLSGTELARPADADGWQPLHAWPVFREEVAHTGDPAAAARWRHLSALGWHAASFLAVMVALGFPFWGIFWGLALAGHAIQAIPSIRAALAPARPAALPAPAAAAAEDPFEARLAALLGALGSPPEAADLAGAARALHAQRLALAAAIADAEGASGPDSGDTPALTDLRGSLQRAQQAHERLATQERDLLHRLEALRLAQLGQDAPAADVGEQLGALQRRLQAEAEVEAHLRAARRAAAQRSGPG